MSKKKEHLAFCFFLLLYLASYNLLIGFLHLNFLGIKPIILTNISMHIEMLFYFLIFHNLLQRAKHRLWLRIFLLLFILAAIGNALFIQPLHVGYSNFSFVVGSSFILLAILFFLKEQILGDGYKRMFRNFWVWYAIALFLFLGTEIPFMSMLNHLAITQADVSAATPIIKTKIIVSSFYYLSFSIAYIVCRNRT